MPNTHSQNRATSTRLAVTLVIFTLVITAGIFYGGGVGAAGGDIDGTFDPGAGANNTVSAVALQPDGKIVIEAPSR